MMRCLRQADLEKRRKLRQRQRLILPAVIAFCAVAAGGVSPSHAQSLRKVDSRLDKVQSQLSEQKKQKEFLSQKSRELWTEEQALQSQTISVARRIQRQESQLTDLEDQLSDLQNREKDATTQLEDKSGQYARILMALERLSTTPPEALIALPRSPQDTLRSAILLKAALPGVEQHAKDLRAELKNITGLRAKIKSRKASLSEGTEKLRKERNDLDGLLKEKRQLRTETEQEAAEAAKAVEEMGREAKNLGELLANIRKRAEGLPEPRAKPDYDALMASHEAETPDEADSSDTNPDQTQLASLGPPDIPDRKINSGSSNNNADTGNSDEELSVGSSITSARGHLRMPAAGKIVALFGQARGAHSKGIEIKTRAHAQVVSPFDGKVVFAGPFRGYGRLLIIEHGEGYHSLVAGFDHLDSVVGQYVLAGEPVGTMGENGPKLYLEMRHDGEAINPLPWLASQNGKVSG